MAKLKFIYSVMNAGKSTHLLQVKHNYETFNSNVLLYTHSHDNRFGESSIGSRLGLKEYAHPVDEGTNIYTDIKQKNINEPVSSVLVDESQFFTYDQIFQLTEISDFLDIPVICYGLKTNAFGELFEGSKALLELADSLEEIKQLCFCGKKATMVRRFDENGKVLRNGEEVVIGSEEQYISMCRKHWKTIDHTDIIDSIIASKNKT